MIIFLIIILIYCFGIFILAFSFIIAKNDKPLEEKLVKISILVPFKNEEKNLTTITQCIINQNYPKEQIELIFINDNSTDGGAELINSFLQKYSFIKLFSLQDEFGKKNALKTGVKNADGEIIIHTDADISFGKNWIKSIVNSFNGNTVLSFGSVVFKDEINIFEKMQSLELLSLTGIAASSAILKHPVLISGANLAYKKELKQDFLDSINEIASGDDMFFLELIKKIYSGKINYIKNKENIVKTKAEKTLNSFVNQRIRWSGKTTKFKDFEILFAGGLSFLANILIVSLFIISLFYNRALNVFLILLAIKFLVELFSIIVYSIYFEKIRNLYLFPILFVLYPFYIVGIAITSFLFKPTWK